MICRACLTRNQAFKSKELSIDLCDQIVTRHRSGSRSSVGSFVMKRQFSTLFLESLPEGEPSHKHSSNQTSTVRWLE